MILVRTTMILAVAALVLSSAITVPADEGEQENLRSEWLDYAGTNLVLNVFGIETLIPVASGCDEAGQNGVRFCETLQPDEEDENWTMPDRVAISVRDSLGPRVGFYWAFKANGSVLANGFACGHVNTWVPHEQMGDESKVWFPNSTELIVIPDVLEAALGRPSVTTVPSIPVGAADTINDALPNEVTVPEDVPELGNETIPVPQVPNETPSPSIGHPFPCGSPTIGTGTVTVDWRYDAPVFATGY